MDYNITLPGSIKNQSKLTSLLAKISFCLIVILFLGHDISYAHTVKDPHTEREHFFRENKGQWDDHILFRADFGANILFIEKTGLTWLQQHPDDLAERARCKFDPKCSFWDFPVRHFAFKKTFKGGNPNPSFVGKNESTEYFNYFRGNDPENWASDVREYQKVVLKNVYEGIDYQIYVKNGVLKYDFIVAPGIDPSIIQLEYDGLLEIEEVYENLKLITGVNDIFEQQPYSFQTIGKEEVYVPSRFNLRDSIVSFEFPSGYDSDLPLIIDPVLIFSSYSGALSDNWGTTATPGLNGELFAGGIAFEPGYPVTTGAFQSSIQAESFLNFVHVDMAITQFSADGTERVYSTYIGGDRTEIPVSLIVNSRGELVIYGISTSSNYPTTLTAFQDSYRGGESLPRGNTNEISINGSDLVVTVLNPTGSALVGSTYISGSDNDGINALDFQLARNYGDQFRGEVIVDQNDNIYVATMTSSSDFPTTANAYQPNFGGGAFDGVIFSLNRNCSVLRFSSYLGGSNSDVTYSIKLDSENNLIVGGGTRSRNFPTTDGALHTNYQGGVTDGFISKLNSNASELISSTFYGTNDYDQVYFVEVDLMDRIYIFGQTRGRLSPTEGVYFNQGGRQFISRLSGDLSELEFQTIFGSGRGDIDISPTALMVDNCNRIYISGWGGRVNREFVPNSSTVGLPVSPDAFQQTTDGNDFYFFVLEEDATDLIYATYFGGVATINGWGAEHVDGGTSRFSREGTIYQAVCAGCGGVSTFPTTPGVVSPNNPSGNCNLGVVKYDFELDEIIARADVVPDIGCAPLTVDFRNFSTGTIDFVWDFNDGDSSRQRSPTHTFEEQGTYEVKLLALSRNNCLEPDSITITVEVLAPTESLIDTFEICDGIPVELSAQLDEPDAEYEWSTGETTQSITAIEAGIYIAITRFENCIYRDTFTVINSTPTVTIRDSIACDQSFLDLNLDPRAEDIRWNTGSTELSIIADEPGDYQVEYTIGGCSFFDRAFITFPVSPEVRLLGDSLACDGEEVLLNVIETKGITIEEYTWSTGETGNAISVTESGTYSVIGLSNEGCDDSSEIEVFFIPQLPPLPEFLDTLICADGSLDVDLSIFENFADIEWADGSTQPIRIFDEGGEYPFVIENICERLEGEVALEKSPFEFGELPMYFPNAFSPNQDGINDNFRPEFPDGIEILSYKLQVFDRWGNKVFESELTEFGWDGIFDGRAMDPAVFAWIAEIEFFVCEEPQKKILEGDITILK